MLLKSRHSPRIASCAGQRTRATALYIALALALPLAAAPAPAAQELPVTAVSLFSSGVGYFEHRGRVSGDASVSLPFSTAEVDDALKSLVLRDPQAGGPAGSPSLSYPSLESVDEALRGLRIDLSGNPGVAEILARQRGAEIEVQVPESVTGRIVSVEKHAQGADRAERFTLALLTQAGLRSIPLEGIASLRFTDPGIASDFSRALALVLGARDEDRRRLDLRFPGSGEREVAIGYIVAAPVWKASYRLVLSGGKPWFQGWAIVDNPSDIDWKEVRLSLVSGRPVSFVQNLYAPLRLERPTLPLSIAGIADARVFDSGLGGSGDRSVEASAPLALGAPPPPAAMAMAKRAEAPREAFPSPTSAFSGAGAAVATLARSAGDQFEFTMDKPVTLERRRSAMLPLVAGAIAAEKFSIYSAGSGDSNPMLGLRVSNSLGMKLPAGPITVFDGGSYAGDALLEFLPENEKRLVVYGQDLSVTASDSSSSSRETVSVAISKGVLVYSRMLTLGRTYEFRNASATPRRLLVEHPLSRGAELVLPLKFGEKTASVYRFALDLPAGGSQKLEVRERSPIAERVVLSGLSGEGFLTYSSSQELKEPLRAALAKAAALQAAVEAARRNLAELGSRREETVADQDRIRKNLETLGSDSSQGQPYLKRLMDSEAILDDLAPRIKDARKAQDQARTAFESYLANLDLR
ncbi:MAG: hypothetical protein ACOYM2_10650 [Rectinemataceae bacterium]